VEFELEFEVELEVELEAAGVDGVGCVSAGW
jgi:hypothetical protein